MHFVRRPSEVPSYYYRIYYNIITKGRKTIITVSKAERYIEFLDRVRIYVFFIRYVLARARTHSHVPYTAK